MIEGQISVGKVIRCELISGIVKSVNLHQLKSLTIKQEIWQTSMYW